MAIVKMKKFKLFALEKDRKSLLKELQKFSYVHFVKTKEEDKRIFVVLLIRIFCLFQEQII